MAETPPSPAGTNGGISRHPLLPYLARMRRFPVLLGLGLLLNLVTVASSIGLLALSGWFISAAAVAGLAGVVFNYAVPSAGIRLFVVTRTVGRYCERLASHEGTFRLLSLLRRDVYCAIERLSPRALLRHGSGDLLTRLTADIDALDGLYLRIVAPTLVALLAVIGCAALIGVFAPAAGVFAGLCLAAAGLVGPWLAWRLGRGPSARRHRLEATLRARLVERLASLPELLLYEGWRRETDELLDTQASRDLDERRLARLTGLSQLVSQGLLGIAVTGTLAFAAAAVGDGALDPALIALIAFTVLAGFEAVALLPPAWQSLARITAAATRLEELSRAAPEIVFPPQDRATPRDGPMEIDDLRVALDGREILSGVSLTLRLDEHLALLGPSGGGKTTLLDAVVRFVEPDGGTLRLGGVELADLGETTLRRAFTVSRQETHLLGETYRENLRIAAPCATDEEMTEILAALGLGPWLTHQPDGLGSYPDEGGSSLSGGELRRFGVARALLRPAPFTLLDEPAEGLDRDTARHVMAEIRRRCAGRGLLVVTHRPEGLESFDRLAFLEAGRIVEAGPPAELARDPESRYALLLRSLTA
ncbi:thiol reductant ABC exporter subunit CydC [Lutibaculum baratangense]|uniref:Transport ATP-binding protein CydC n=1 Tax=Lutibaculum baratangense AMV1 TaxID=631454 RepID=V4QVC1_9HYPH|nr:thiol reductant ABC exporter subunit CydC [Lutibaculum baratangense]ESR23717.1 Transport ATP-binding protein CydC [Lutibaculum baratangense AMV1]